ncbi:GTP-binding protein EngB required for normal cell division [Micromonospora purpureochromogenes]|uniref:GTP-binding protein EngB required for normal cell division n=1 Tax=Micromonospora purpureochromogenes TaxID=47872 RepID=A0A1C4UKH8_9ACTN|nr:GTPase [Micromonospora purpureochromogenes]SCE72137.1 GTP-binding protein EngB required for normal cell division [Micromonospora purpureochromogenes]
MTGIVGRMREAFRGEQRVDADDLVARLDAVRRFLAAVDGQVPDSRLVTAHTLVERAGTRLALSRDHTVVALAGATGSGKSSLFNALARLDLSPVGVRRPTTGVAHACVWGRLDGANRLLDWVGVLPRHRFVRESALDADDETGLHGLVLLDLPDFDSVQRSHRLEVDRLLGLVDLVVWVVDPQKYADRVIHTSYLREFHRHRDVTLVVLNQADRLSATELPRVLDDLRRLLDADGLDGVPLLATTAVHPGGLTGLREALERAVSERQASLRRLSGDVDAVVAGLGELVVTDVPRDAPDEDTVRSLDRALAGAAGVPAVADAVQGAYRHRAGGTTGWPVVRGWRRLRPDPLRRLHLPGPAAGADRPEESLVAATSVPDPTAAQRSALGLAIRAVADRSGAGLPAPWPDAVTTAARSRLDDLPDALDRAIAGTDLGMDRRPLWWRLVGGVQWLVTLAALAGLGWLLLGYALRALGLPALEYPRVGEVPLPTLLLLGGLLAGLLVAAVTRPVIRWAARRARQRAEKRLSAAVAGVGDTYVLSPVRAVLDRYGQARDALRDAAR